MEEREGKGEQQLYGEKVVKAKVLMCCSQSQLVLALPGFLASGAYWVSLAVLRLSHVSSLTNYCQGLNLI